MDAPFAAVLVEDRKLYPLDAVGLVLDGTRLRLRQIVEAPDLLGLSMIEHLREGLF
jgi:hypothetical protein